MAMGKKLVYWSGLLGVLLFVGAALLGALQIEDYNPISQYISETYATGTPYGEKLRYFGYLPSGLLLTAFAFLARNHFPKNSFVKLGFWGLAVFYGMATVLVALFPCDAGCNKAFIDPSISQIIHNLIGFLTYAFVPLSIILIGIGLRQHKVYAAFTNLTVGCGLFSMLFVGLLFADPLSDFAGLYQRIIEGTFMLWIVVCSLFIKNSSTPLIKERGNGL
jgi:hypothetical protein